MTKEEARTHLINWIEFATNSDKHPFMDEPCSDDEILEAMQFGADALCQQQLPSNLDEAAGEYSDEHSFHFCDYDITPYDAFKAGAEWMAGQGETIEGEVVKDKKNNLAVLARGLSGKNAVFGDKVIVQIRKKQ